MLLLMQISYSKIHLVPCYHEIQMYEIVRVINCHDVSLEEKEKVVYIPMGFLKVTIVNFVLQILMIKGYCREFVLFTSL